MLKISAVIMLTATIAGFMFVDPTGNSEPASVAASDPGVVRVKTVAIRPSFQPTLVSTFEPTTKWQPRANFRRKSSRVAAIY